MTQMTRHPAPRAITRRLTVLAMVLSYCAAYTVSMVAPDATGAWSALLAGTLFGLLVLFLLTRNMSNRFDNEMDERELQVRDRAHRTAYWALAPLIGIFVGAVHSAANDQAVTQRVQLAVTLDFAPCMSLLAGVALLYLGLPTAILAWQEPDTDNLA